jgi:hypothetical protein
MLSGIADVVRVKREQMQGVLDKSPTQGVIDKLLIHWRISLGLTFQHLAEAGRYRWINGFERRLRGSLGSPLLTAPGHKADDGHC